jgi:hypothetical protein
VVRDDVDFTVGYQPVFRYLIKYLRHIHHPLVDEESTIDSRNVSNFLAKHVRIWEDQPDRRGMIRLIGTGARQVALNAAGWIELLKVGRVKLDKGLIKLYKK